MMKTLMKVGEGMGKRMTNKRWLKGLTQKKMTMMMNIDKGIIWIYLSKLRFTLFKYDPWGLGFRV